jgi:hypothetical protein
LGIFLFPSAKIFSKYPRGLLKISERVVFKSEMVVFKATPGNLESFPQKRKFKFLYLGNLSPGGLLHGSTDPSKTCPTNRLITKSKLI